MFVRIRKNSKDSCLSVWRILSKLLADHVPVELQVARKLKAVNETIAPTVF